MGKKVGVGVIGYDEDEDGQVAVVALPKTVPFQKKGVPHVTISHSDRVGPKYSNELLKRGIGSDIIGRPGGREVRGPTLTGIIDTVPSSFTRKIVRDNPRRRKGKNMRRNPVRRSADGRWDVIKPDGTVDLTLGDEQVARRLAAACGYDAAPAQSAPRKAAPSRESKSTPRKPAAPRKAAAPRKPAASARSKSDVPRIEGYGNVDAFCKAEYWYDTKREALKKAVYRKDFPTHFEAGERAYKEAFKEAVEKGGVTENQFMYIQKMCELQEVIDKWEEYKAIAEQYKAKFGKPLAKEFESTVDKKYSPAWELRRAGWKMRDARDKVMKDEEPNRYDPWDTLSELESVKDDIQKILNQTYADVTIAKRKLTGQKKGPFLDRFKLVIDVDGEKYEFTSNNWWALKKECDDTYDHVGWDYDCTYYWKEFGGEWQKFDKASWDRLDAMHSRQNPSRRTRRPRRRRRR